MKTATNNNDWISTEDGQMLAKTDQDRTIMLFDTGEICMYNDEWPHTIATHFFELPELPKN